VVVASKTVFTCQSCGHVSPKWLGRCPECEAWSSFSEEVRAVARKGAAAAASGKAARVQSLGQVRDQRVTRFASGIELLDRVLGGGIVAGGAVLLAGEPGIGKSTLLLQMAEALARGGQRTLYVTAEESPRQLRMRAERLGCGHPDLLVAGENSLEPILAAADSEEIAVLLVDSVQALRSGDLESPAGAIGQVRHAADRLVALAKRREVALFLVGHVTKDGAIAGPKSLEHLVDTVLSFEGEAESQHRVLRASKNRFGPVGEVALFEMRDHGLVPVADPSGALLARRRPASPGSAVVPTLQGSRPLLVEVQALANPTKFSTPRRMAVGVDANRMILLVAVLERFGGLALAECDLFLNAVGGLALREPASDLAVAAALISAVRGKPLPADAVFFGELGLLGEARPVAQSEARLREASHHGFRRAFAPKVEGLRVPRGLTLFAIEDLGDLAAALLRG
jgi:DNA repair protein RadA/Sms